MQYCGKCPDAVARITGGAEVPQLSGCAQFYQENGYVLVVARISGLPRESETGFFGFHIHQGRDCSGASFSGTGSHYNPAEQAHTEAIPLVDVLFEFLLDHLPAYAADF